MTTKICNGKVYHYHALTLRIPRNIKEAFWDVCKKNNTTPTIAINGLMRECSKCTDKGNAPFRVEITHSSSKISKILKSKENRLITVAFSTSLLAKEQFSKFCATTMRIPVSTMVKIFMLQCIESQRILCSENC